MAPPHSLKHLAIRALNTTSLHIGARVGNFYATGSNYSCTPLELTYSNAVPPISIGVVNGSLLDVPSFWSSPSDSVLNVSTLEHIATINTGDHGDLSWDVDVDVGSYIAFKAEDASGAIAYSQLRTVYYGGASDKECS